MPFKLFGKAAAPKEDGNTENYEVELVCAGRSLGLQIDGKVPPFKVRPVAPPATETEIEAGNILVGIGEWIFPAKTNVSKVLDTIGTIMNSEQPVIKLVLKRSKNQPKKPIGACWTCTRCTVKNEMVEKVCTVCQLERPESAVPAPKSGGGGGGGGGPSNASGPTWQCGQCTYSNPMTKDECEMCGMQKGGGKTPPAEPEAPPAAPTYPKVDPAPAGYGGYAPAAAAGYSGGVAPVAAPYGAPHGAPAAAPYGAPHGAPHSAPYAGPTGPYGAAPAAAGPYGAAPAVAPYAAHQAHHPAASQAVPYGARGPRHSASEPAPAYKPASYQAEPAPMGQVVGVDVAPWKCGLCTTMNSGDTSGCITCNAPRLASSKKKPPSARGYSDPMTKPAAHQAHSHAAAPAIGYGTAVRAAPAASVSAVDKKWKCPHCNYVNPSQTGTCLMCNASVQHKHRAEMKEDPKDALGTEDRSKIATDWLKKQLILENHVRVADLDAAFRRSEGRITEAVFRITSGFKHLDLFKTRMERFTGGQVGTLKRMLTNMDGRQHKVSSELTKVASRYQETVDFMNATHEELETGSYLDEFTSSLNDLNSQEDQLKKKLAECRAKKDEVTLKMRSAQIAKKLQYENCERVVRNLKEHLAYLSNEKSELNVQTEIVRQQIENYSEMRRHLANVKLQDLKSAIKMPMGMKADLALASPVRKEVNVSKILDSIEQPKPAAVAPPAFSAAPVVHQVAAPVTHFAAAAPVTHQIASVPVTSIPAAAPVAVAPAPAAPITQYFAAAPAASVPVTSVPAAAVAFAPAPASVPASVPHTGPTSSAASEAADPFAGLG